MNHLSRLLSILTVLKSKSLVTGPELADRYGVSVRTIYRDIKKLEESGVPIVMVEGRGYSILDGYSIAPIMFEEQEVNALVTAEQLIKKTNDQSLIADFEETLTKIKAVFKSSLQSQSELLSQKMLVIKTDTPQAKTNSLSAIQMAIINFRVMEMAYTDKNGAQTSRSIEPLAIYSFDDVWIVLGWCHLRDDYRSFRLDRIRQFKILDTVFEDRNFDFTTYFQHCAEKENHP